MYSVRGNRVQFSMFGESHGPAIGMTIHGFPEGIAIDKDCIAAALLRRRTGGQFSSQRQEDDCVEWLSGTKEREDKVLVTTGAPLTFAIYNHDHRPKDYSELSRVVRPSHADLPAHIKYNGHNDVSGGGMFSGRLTAVYVVAGQLCNQCLKAMGIRMNASIVQLGRLRLPMDARDYSESPTCDRRTWLESLKPEWRQLANEILLEVQQNGDSVGGQVQLVATGMPIGIGDPQLYSMESELSAWLFSIPGLKALGFGLGEDFASAYGSQVNDSAFIDNGVIQHRSNNNGGIFGGMTNGMPLLFRATFKPTPSIYKPQNSIDVVSMREQPLEIKGRHDPAFVIRTPVVVESVTAMALFDFMRSDFK